MRHGDKIKNLSRTKAHREALYVVCLVKNSSMIATGLIPFSYPSSQLFASSDRRIPVFSIRLKGSEVKRLLYNWNFTPTEDLNCCSERLNMGSID